MNQNFTSALETLEPTKLKLTITVSAESFREAIVSAYNKNKHHFNVQGFRKGKVPRKIVEQYYGREVFYEEAMNTVLPDAYEAALDQHEIEPVYRPEIDAGPASESEGAVFYATVYIRPEAEVDEYYGLLYPKTSPEATEEDIENAIKAEQTRSATQVSVDRPAEMGDILTINFVGYFGDEPFEGGEGHSHELTLGSKQFIDTFEEQLVGSVPGDDVTVNVTFPEEYHSAEHAGKAARFEVEVIDVQGKVLPEIDDDFAANVSEFDTLAEYKEDLANTIRKNKEQNLENMKRGHIMRQLSEKTKVEIPEAMYLARLDDMAHEFEHQIRAQGMDPEMYMRFSQITPEGLRATWRPQAEVEVKNMLALEAVAKKEALVLDEGEFETRFGKMINQEGEQLATTVETLPPFRRKELERSMLCEKAMEFLLDKAIETDEPMPVLPGFDPAQDAE